MINLICPVCKEALLLTERTYKCKSNHSFDKAKEGYVNLLVGKHKDGSLIGDNKDMAKSRKAFLEKGYYSALSKGLIDIIKSFNMSNLVIADICCGEGYYGNEIKKSLECEACGFDISKEMIRLASKRKNSITYFVANLSRIPLQDNSIDVAFHLFAPFHEKELKRITKNEGYIITVVSGENHLFELKSILYESPYKNDEMPPKTEVLKLIDKIKITEKVILNSSEDIEALFKMTPYYYHTKEEDKAKLTGIEALEVTVDFAVYVYKK